MKRIGAVALIGIAVSMFLARGAGATSLGASVFERYAAAVKSDLAGCTSSVTSVRDSLGEVLGASSVPAGTYAQIDRSAASALARCGARDRGIQALESLTVPSQLRWIESLQASGAKAARWATVQTAQVLHDVQSLMTSKGDAYAAGAALDTDVQVADSDAASLRAAFSHAAGRVHAPFSGLGLVIWTS